jgi:hypothetical protein
VTSPNLEGGASGAASAYLFAAQRARALAGTLSDTLAAQLADDLDIFARTVLAELLALHADTPAERRRALRESHAVIVRAATVLDATMAGAIQVNRALTFDEVSTIYREASAVAARSEGAAFGAIRIPRVNLYAVYHGNAADWRTTLRDYIDNAATELDSLIRTALLQGISPADLAVQLRPYVQGAETFYQAFPASRFGKTAEAEAQKAMRTAWKQLPEDLRGAAKQIRYNARRIASSELHTAYGNALKTNGLADPLIEGYVWTLSPAHPKADICDALATSDFYGGGPGWFPKTMVPEWPHPFCWCSLAPTLRPFARVNDPLPTNRRIAEPKTVSLPKYATPRAEERVREQLGALLDFAEQPLSPAERALLAHGAATARSWQRLAHTH